MSDPWADPANRDMDTVFQVAFLVRNGVPLDVAFRMDSGLRQAWVISLYVLDRNENVHGAYRENPKEFVQQLQDLLKTPTQPYGEPA
jgi:hypothetical protein